MVDKNAHYLMCKGGVFYFTRHVPNDLQRHYETPRIVICLKTRNRESALRASRSMAAKLDDFWLQMRLSHLDVPASDRLLKQQPVSSFTSSAPKLSDALAKYCALKGADKGKLFFTVADRNVGYVIECLDDRPLDAYCSSDAAKFRDWLIDRSLSTASIKRIFSTIRAVFNLTIQELGLRCSNAFANTYLPSDVRPKRAVISPEDIKRVQKVCLDIADERRLLIALISDTGMRLSEAIGLVWDDIHLEHEIPHLNLKPHPWRRLKTSGSKRLIPLVGASLEAIKIMHRQCDNPFLFKSYASKDGCNGNSCSATLNKWLKQHISDAVIHSFRHSFRDRLRNSGVQTEMIDQLGGWSRQSVGRSYGNGFSLRLLHLEMKQCFSVTHHPGQRSSSIMS
jgi:integrase